MEKKALAPASCFILPADFTPKSPDEVNPDWLRASTLALWESVRGTGIVTKINTVHRVLGQDMCRAAHEDFGLEIMADLKVFDIKNTLQNDGKFLRIVKPEILTAVCAVGRNALKALAGELPETEIFGITVLTDVDEAMCQRLYGHSVEYMVLKFAEEAAEAGIAGVVASPKELASIKGRFGDQLQVITPGARPKSLPVKGDDQERVMTVEEAIRAGASRIVCGRPVLQAPDRREAIQKVLAEILAGWQ